MKKRGPVVPSLTPDVPNGNFRVESSEKSATNIINKGVEQFDH